MLRLEAYKGRGRGDCLQSKDIEDVIAVIDGRPEIGIEVTKATAEVRSFIALELEALLAEPNFAYAVDGYLHEEPERSSTVYERIQDIIGRPAQ